MRRSVIFAIMLSAVLAVFGGFFAYAEEEAADTAVESADDLFDTSDEEEQVSELGIPTPESVADLKEKADSLYDEKSYKDAAQAYANYAKNANWLANLLSQTLEPYYGAAYDDRKSFSPEVLSISTMSGVESLANAYKAERNRAYLYEGLCYKEAGDNDAALPLLLKALDIIEIDQEDYWKEAMDAVLEIIGVYETALE